MCHQLTGARERANVGHTLSVVHGAVGEARAPSHPSSHHYKLGQLSSAQCSTERYHSRRLNHLNSQGDGLQCLEDDETPGEDSKNNDLQSFL